MTTPENAQLINAEVEDNPGQQGREVPRVNRAFFVRLSLAALLSAALIAGVVMRETLLPAAFRRSRATDIGSLMSASEVDGVKVPRRGQVVATDGPATSTTFTVTLTTLTVTSTTLTTITETTTRKGSFLVIGDWGFDAQTHGTFKDNGCQRLIADTMLQTMRSLGDVKFVVNVGDSFYPQGVKSKSDPQWQTKWRDIFGEEVRSVPWYSTYGNHDYQGDPCACAETPADCAQVNFDCSNKDFFCMPGLSYNVSFPDLDLELVGLDLNYYMWGWNTQCEGKEGRKKCSPEDCVYTDCDGKCRGNLQWRAKEAFDLFNERAQKSTAKNLVVFSHYPTDYLWNETEFLGKLSDPSKHHIEYFGGHRHSVDQQSTWQTKPNNNWLVGGGGGWGCEGGFYMYPPRQGFVVGEIDAYGGLTTYSVLVNHTTCCPTITKPAWKPKFEY
jgi:hypothetical protein